ncbi:hypothetical protein STSP2_00098 [Anaerohalosphaera lusitana]|uniref:Uncharacterized protein n=1 Tax=Anaerohalosphaera lusitana TaxID=1936003 RepID=A0A1U9NH79_9BACT|nr:bacteriophage holin [Anaerohalosphaera lusitana]AQT66960.1 hypothetical protein STSP2_00098 [Anaerohalosphaera lusitana]
MKLNVKAFALACGLIWGLGVLLMTWYMIAIEGPSDDKFFLGRFYLGYNLTALGSVIAMVWGFFDALIGGAIFAWLYNFLSRKKS